MRSFQACGFIVALLLASQSAMAQDRSENYRPSSLLPLPPANQSDLYSSDYPASPATAYTASANNGHRYPALSRASYRQPTINQVDGEKAVEKSAVADEPTGSGLREGKNDFLNAMSAPWGCCDTGCAPCGTCCPCWIVELRGLVMDRNDENPVYFSYDTDDESVQLLKSREADMKWSGGFEVHVIRPFCCCQFAWEVAYWGLFPGTQEANLYASDMVGSLYSTYDFDPLYFNNGVDPAAPVNDWYDGAERHRLRRSYEIHNVELNLFNMPMTAYADCNDCMGALSLNWLCGFRYFQFDEGLEFGTDYDNTTFDNPLEELFYNIDVQNRMVGFQLGFGATYQMCHNTELVASTKFGVYNNYMHQRSRIGNELGAAYVNGGPNDGRSFDVISHKDEIAFMGELDLGVKYQFAPRWKLTGGYRVMAVSGVALTTNQIPYNFAGIDDVADIANNGDLVLHGAYAGLEFAW